MKSEAEKREFMDGFLFIFDKRTGELEVVETENNSPEEAKADCCSADELMQG